MHGTRRYSIRLDSACPPTLLELIATRFDVVPEPAPRPESLIIDNMDQVSLRALLLLLWDAGQSLRSVTPVPAAEDAVAEFARSLGHPINR